MRVATTFSSGWNTSAVRPTVQLNGASELDGALGSAAAPSTWPYPGSCFEDPDYGTYRMTRGGVFNLDSDLARCDRRHGAVYSGPTGFRLARSAADEWLGRSA